MVEGNKKNIFSFIKEIRWCYLACIFFRGLYEYENMFGLDIKLIFCSIFFSNCQVFANTHKYSVAISILKRTYPRIKPAISLWKPIIHTVTFFFLKKNLLRTITEEKINTTIAWNKNKTVRTCFFLVKNQPQNIFPTCVKNNVGKPTFELIIIKKYVTWIKRFPLFIKICIIFK